MPSDKLNSEMARATSLISSLFNVTSSQDMNFCSSKACIAVLPKLSFVLHSFLHYHVGGDSLNAVSWLYGLVTAVIAEVLLTLSFCLKCSVKMLDTTENKAL